MTMLFEHRRDMESHQITARADAHPEFDGQPFRYGSRVPCSR